MQLYILDKDPVKSAQMIPDKYKFKMLIELRQLICSAGISNVYKSVPQGKELQEWVKNNIRYVKEYKCNIPSKTLLPIEVCIKEYNKYLEWKLK